MVRRGLQPFIRHAGPGRNGRTGRTSEQRRPLCPVTVEGDDCLVVVNPGDSPSSPPWNLAIISWQPNQLSEDHGNSGTQNQLASAKPRRGLLAYCSQGAGISGFGPPTCAGPAPSSAGRTAATWSKSSFCSATLPSRRQNAIWVRAGDCDRCKRQPWAIALVGFTYKRNATCK